MLSRNVDNYLYVLLNNPEEGSSQLLRGSCNNVRHQVRLTVHLLWDERHRLTLV